MINNTDALYPKTTSFKHPKAGQPNSAVRVGVVPAAGGPTVWMQDAGRSARPLHPADRVGRQRRRSHLPATQPTAEHQSASSSATRRRARSGRSSSTRTRPGSTTWTASSGWTEARACSGSASATAGGTPTTSRATAARSGCMTPGRLRRHERRRRRREERAGSTSPPRPTTRPQRFVYRVRMDGRASPSASGPPGRPASTATTSRRRPAGRSTASRRSTRRPQTELVRLPERRDGPAPGGQRTRCGRRSRRSRRKRVEFFKLDIGGGVQVDALAHPAARLRPGEEVSAPRLRLRRARRPDRPGRLGRQQLSLAPDARPAGLHRRQLRQPRHARAARPGLAQERLPPDRHPGLGRSGGRGPGGHRRLAVRRRRAGRQSGAGAAAGR